jgi:hypothetical protein
MSRRMGRARRATFPSLTGERDDRLAPGSLGRVEGSHGVGERRDGADVRPQSSVPHPLDDLTQLGAVGLDNEVDRQAVGGFLRLRLAAPWKPVGIRRAFSIFGLCLPAQIETRRL